MYLYRLIAEAGDWEDLELPKGQSVRWPSVE